MNSVRHAIIGTALLAALLTVRPSPLFLCERANKTIEAAALGTGHRAVPSSMSQAQGVPTFVIPQEGSSIKFHVKASVAIDGTFDKWDATLKLALTDAETGVLEVKIQAASVDTGNNMKDGKLKGKDFFACQEQPAHHVSFKRHSNKMVQTLTAYRADSPYAVSQNPRLSSLQFPDKEQAQHD